MEPADPEAPAGEPARPLSATDLSQFPPDLPSGPVRWELHRGALVTLPPPGYAHRVVEGNLADALKTQGERPGYGKVRSCQVRLILARGLDHVLGADVVFIARVRLPVRRSPEGYLETVPDLVVQVRGKLDAVEWPAWKAGEYLAAGARLVWVADPRLRTVTEYRPGAAPVTYGEADTLAVEDIIPGFRLAVSVALRG